MTPITFKGCFGWLHQNAGTANQRIAILLCSALHHDALNAYHAQRLLAEQLSASGYPTMRFDYPQTGDSCDVEGFDFDSDIDLWHIWLESVQEAADVLRHCTGASGIVLCGLRIGGMLAALAAARRDDVVGLVLLAPVTKGQSYLRQIWVEAQHYDRTIPPIEDGIQFQDICFNRRTVAAIGATNLRDIDLSAKLKIAVFAQSQGRLLEESCRAWASRGGEVFCADFDGLQPMLSMNVEDDKGHPNFDRLLDWVHQSMQPGESWIAPRHPEPATHLTPPYCIETPLRFGAGGRLFGILCRPANETVSEVVLIVNAGRDPRHGPGRFSVEWSRRLAKDGIASLRFDFAGLGDSFGPPGQEAMLSSLMNLDRSGDVSAAIDALGRCGFLDFTVYGLCSGAYHAMLAAVVDPRISRLLLVNIPLFSRSGDAGVDFIRHRNVPLRYFVAEIAKLRSWAALRQKLPKTPSVLRAQFMRFSAKLASAQWSPLQWLGRFSGGNLTPGQKNMAILARRKVRILLLFGEGDLGLDAVTQQFGTLGSGQALGENVTLQVLEDFDHLVSQERTRRGAERCMLNFLHQTRETPQLYSIQAARFSDAKAGLPN